MWQGAEGKRPLTAEFGRNCQRRQLIDPSETPQPFDARPQRLEGEESSQIIFHGAQSDDRLVNRAKGTAWHRAIRQSVNPSRPLDT